MPSKLFIIIVTWNGEKFIHDCLNSIYAQDELDFDIIIVDNNSTDKTKEIIKSSFEKVLLIENDENAGFAAGNNIGIKNALDLGANYIALLNQDTEVSKDFVKLCVKHLKENDETGLVSPIILFPKDDKIWFAGSKIFRGREILKHPTTKVGEHTNKKCSLSNFGGNTNADWIPACAVFIKKDVFKKIGLFDEKFFMYGEDVDFSLRAHRAGYKLDIESNTTIIHKEKYDSKIKFNKGLIKKIAYKFRARYIIISRYYSFKEKCYYLIKLVYTPIFQLAYAFRKIFS